MIVFLDESLVDGLNPSALDHAIFSLIPIVIQQYLEGNHMICASPGTFEEIIRYREKFTRRIAAGVIRAYEKMPVRGGLLKTTRRIVRVVNAGEPMAKMINATQREIIIPADLILNCSSLVSQPLLVVENERDGQFFARLVKSISARSESKWAKALGALHLRCEITPGGGNTTGDVYLLKKKAASRIGIAVVDSDKASPGGALGDTAKAVQKADVETSPFFEHFILRTRTIENLIPSAELISIAAELDSAEEKKAVQVINTLYNSADWGFHSIKRGLRCIEMQGQSADAIYWSPKFQKQCDTPCIKMDNCKHHVIPPLSAKILDRAATRTTQLPFSSVEPPALEAAWDELCQLLASWFCGEQPAYVT